MYTYIIVVLFILVLMIGWIAVQYSARAFSAKHPELGPAREEGGGCGTTHCNSCSSSHSCSQESHQD